MMMQRPDYYSILGAQPSDDAMEIRTKYRQAALRLHPDKGGSSEAFQRLTVAFEVLSCPCARAVYNINQKQIMMSTKKAKYPANRVVKRQAAPNDADPGAKRQCKQSRPRGSCRKDAANLQKCIALISTPLRQLRDVLQHMKPDERRVSLQTLPPCVQAGLVLFMEKLQETSAKHPPTEVKTSPSCASVRNTSAASGITACPKTLTQTAGSRYKAHAHMKALRFYARSYDNLEMALNHQMILVQIRQSLSQASLENPRFWDDPKKAYQICSAVMDANATSEADLGLCTYIYLRAGHWLVQSRTIISPVMPLWEALQLHSRLLHARATSWQELRTEWVQLMQSKRLPMSKRKTPCEAETIADAERSSALKIQLQKIANNTAKAMGLAEKQHKRWQKSLAHRDAREKHREARAKRAEAAAVQQAMKAKEQAWRERQRWCRRSDATIDDIMKGPPMSVIGGCMWEDFG